MTAPGCGWLARRRALTVVARAFAQAMTEHGIPPHPGGECPAPGCPCRDLEDQVTGRAVQLAAAALGVTPESLDPRNPP
jgi:hypothetical protein